MIEEIKIMRYDVIPKNDSHTHSLNCTCPCLPQIFVGEKGYVFQHSSFDGREVLEKLSLPTKPWEVIETKLNQI